MMLCTHGNKGSPDLVVTMGYSAFWCPQRTEVSTTAGEEGHIIAGHTPLSPLAVPGRTFCIVIGKSHYPRPRHQGGEGPTMAAGYTFFFSASGKALLLNGGCPVHTADRSTRWAEWLLLSQGLSFVDAVPVRVPLTYKSQKEVWRQFGEVELTPWSASRFGSGVV